MDRGRDNVESLFSFSFKIRIFVLSLFFPFHFSFTSLYQYLLTFCLFSILCLFVFSLSFSLCSLLSSPLLSHPSLSSKVFVLTTYRTPAILYILNILPVIFRKKKIIFRSMSLDFYIYLLILSILSNYYVLL